MNKVLEFGGGPVLWPSFLLAQYSDAIHFCDYAPCNLNAVTDWINQTSNPHNWSVLFDYVLIQYQYYNQKRSDTRADCEERLRDALRLGGLETCDVNAPNCPVLSDSSDQYNLIFTSLCLEAACLTDTLYKETIKRFYRLLTPGGMLLMLIVRRQTSYYVEENHFFCLSLEEYKVTNALNESKFLDIHITSHDRNPSHLRTSSSDYDGFMVVHAFKSTTMKQD